MPYSLPPEWGGSNQPGFWGQGQPPGLPQSQIDPNTGSPGSSPFGAGPWATPPPLGNSLEDFYNSLIPPLPDGTQPPPQPDPGPSVPGADTTTAELGQEGTRRDLEQYADQLEGAGGGDAPPFGGGGGGRIPGAGDRYWQTPEGVAQLRGMGVPDSAMNNRSHPFWQTPAGQDLIRRGGAGGGPGGGTGGGGSSYDPGRVGRMLAARNPFLNPNSPAAWLRGQPYTPIPPVFPGAGGYGTPLIGGGGGIPGAITGGQTQGSGLETGGPGQNAEANQEMFGDLVEAWQGSFDQSNQANESRYQDILQGYLAQLGRGKDILSETDEGLGIAGGAQSDRWRRVGGNLEAMEGDLERSREGLTGRMQGEQARLEDLLGSLGEQGREDIEEDFSRRGSQVDQDMINRGLGNTTVRGSQMANLQEQKGDALGRFYENLVREQVGLGERGLGRELGLGTFGLGQEEAGIGRRYDYGVAGQQFGEQQIERQLGQDRLRLATETGLPSEMLQFMERREDTGPEMMDLFQLAMLFGQFGSGDFRARPIGGQYTQLAPQQVG